MNGGMVRPQLSDNLEFPEGPVSLNSAYYIERSPLEELAYQEIQRPGGSLRIQAPRKMGKSSLLIRIAARAKSLNYRLVSLDFQEAEQATFQDLQTFLRWFCIRISRQVNPLLQLDHVWDKDMGSKGSCTLYMEEVLREADHRPLVLILNEVNHVLEYPELARDFFSLLRYWSEKAQQGSIFRQLRWVMANFTEIYRPTTQALFNGGLSLELPPFNLSQVQDLTQRHSLSWLQDRQVRQLMDLTGGHPYLVRLACFHLSQGTLTFPQLMQEAATQGGLYSTHLQRQFRWVEEDADLAVALKQVMANPAGVQLEPTLAHQLKHLGIVKLVGNLCQPACQLYAHYFQSQTFEQASQQPLYGQPFQQVAQLEQENQRLLNLIHTDELTQVGNRRYFDQSLQHTWEQLAHRHAPLSLILCDVDSFKAYNDTYGHQQGDTCLRQVAATLKNFTRTPFDLVARYGGEEFAIILPRTLAEDAVRVAEKLRTQIRDLALPHAPSLGTHPVVTVSFGVATIIPDRQIAPDILIQAADEAMYRAKAQGRDQVCLSKTLNFGA